MKKDFLKIFVLIFVFGAFLTACQEEFKPDTETAEDNARAENALGDVFALVSNNTSGDGGKSFLEDTTDECFTRVIDTLEDGTFRLTLTFDSTGCDSGDGVIRKGQIITTFAGNWFEDKTKIVTTTFNNFSRDDVVLTGEVKIEFLGLENLKPRHQLTATGMKLSFPDGKEITWSGTRTVKWLSGFLTRRIRKDDKIEINSEYAGVGRGGSSYTTLGENLVKDFACEYKQPVSGRFTITKPETGDVLTIDFGAGECDGEYTVTQNGTTVSIAP